MSGTGNVKTVSKTFGFALCRVLVLTYVASTWRVGGVATQRIANPDQPPNKSIQYIQNVGGTYLERTEYVQNPDSPFEPPLSQMAIYLSGMAVAAGFGCWLMFG